MELLSVHFFSRWDAKLMLFERILPLSCLYTAAPLSIPNRSLMSLFILLSFRLKSGKSPSISKQKKRPFKECVLPQNASRPPSPCHDQSEPSYFNAVVVIRWFRESYVWSNFGRCSSMLNWLLWTVSTLTKENSYSLFSFRQFSHRPLQSSSSNEKKSRDRKSYPIPIRLK